MVVSYEELLDKLKKGTRKGNWRKLSRKEKGLYRAAVAYMKPRKKGEMARDIVNKIVVCREIVGTHRKAIGDVRDEGVRARIREGG